MNKNDDVDSKFSFLSFMISHVANESVLLTKYESGHSSVKFTELWPELSGAEFDESIHEALRHLGGPPEYFLVPDGKVAPPSDNYPEAAMSEIFSVYQRARKSVIRTHMYNKGSSFILANKTLLSDISESQETRDLMTERIAEAFWEHAESAYIRLCSYWDRIGQLLDFAFFNIRKFDQNGFNAVMERIHGNVLPMNCGMASCQSWLRLRKFQNSERDDGLKLLLQRRNLIIHSLHLHPVKENEKVFESQVNHLDKAHREKLKPRTPDDEVALLMGQLERAGQLFQDILRVIPFSPSRKVDMFL